MRKEVKSEELTWTAGQEKNVHDSDDLLSPSSNGATEYVPFSCISRSLSPVG
jgi:hypothetical protein